MTSKPEPADADLVAAHDLALAALREITPAHTIGDPTWEPLSFGWLPAYMPNFPAWVSGHATFGAAHAAIMRNWFNTDEVTFTITPSFAPGVSRRKSPTSWSSGACCRAGCWTRS